MDVERQKSNTQQAQVHRFVAENQQLSQHSNGGKKMLPSCKLAALSFGITLTPRSMSEMKDISLKSWSGSTWKNVSANLQSQEVEEWVLMTPS